MLKKIFISFLGTNKYIPCNYYFMDKNKNYVKNVEFIQEALIEIFFKQKYDNSLFLFFLTKKAKEVNWNNLETRIKNKVSNFFQIKPIDIPDGKSEKEIWEIFEKVYENIPEKSSIIFDITHAFRSIPMLAISLLNYAKVLKNIKVEGIYYGAVETLGTRKEIENMPLNQRNAPIFELTQFNELIDWSNAAYDFINYGIATKLKEMNIEKIKPVLKATKGKDEIAQKIRFISNELDKISLSLSTVRGKEIYEDLNFTKIREYLKEIKDNIKIQPFKPLVVKINNKISDFEKGDIKNLFLASKFCYEHNLIQQSITILQEAIITYYCEKFNFNYTDLEKRNLIAQLFIIKNRNIPENKWKSPAGDNKYLTKQILNKIDRNFANYYNSLTNLRNDINHAGFLENRIEAGGFKKKIENYYKKITGFIFNEIL